MDQQMLDALANLQQAIQSQAAGTSLNNELLKRMAEKQGVDLKNMNEGMATFGKNVSNANAATRSMQSGTESYDKALNELKNATIAAVGGFKSLSSAVLDTSRNFSKYNTALSGMGDAAKQAGDALGGIFSIAGNVVKGLTMVGNAALKQADNVTKAYDDFAKVGGAGGITTKEIMDMGLNAGLMSKDLGKLTGAIKANSTAMTGLGANAAEGAKVFGQMAAVGTETIANYSKLGVSQEELLKTQSDYVALQMLSGRSLKGELADRQKLQKASLEYQDNLLTLSQLTGEDVESIKSKQKEASLALEWQISQTQKENQARRLEASGRTEEAKKLREEIASRQKGLEATAAYGNKAVTEGLREYMATGTTTGKGTQALVRLGLSNAMAEYKKTIAEGGDANKAAAKFQDAYNKATLDAVDKVGFSAARSQEAAEAYGLSTKSLENVTKRRDTNLEKESDAAKARIEAQKKTEDPALKARAALTEMEIKLGTALERFLSAINPLLEGFNTRTVTGFLGATAAVTAGMMALGSLTKKMGGSAVSGMFGGGRGMPSMPGMPGGRGAPGVPSSGGAGGAVEVLGKGNLLEAAASGLKAFADPRVMVGAVGFGAAITAVGAGIAGATWIISKTLPTLAEGLEPFEKLDGEKLISSGKGIGAIGAGLAVFGAGGVAAGFGAIASSISDGLLSFFGGTTPFKKIEEFSELDINAEKVEKNSHAVVEFSKAMLALGGGTAASGLGTIVGAVGESIGKFFEVDPPLEKMKKFSELDIKDPEKVKINSEAFVAFSNAMATYKGGATESMTSALAENVSTFLQVDPPFKKFVDFSKLDISDPEKVKKNATAFVAFSDAMAKSELSGGAIAGIGNLVGGIAEAAGKLVGNKTAVDKFVEFSKLNIDPDKTGKMAEAFRKYAEAMGVLQGGVRPSTSSSSVSGGGGYSGGASGGTGAPSSGGASGGTGAPSSSAGGAKYAGSAPSISSMSGSEPGGKVGGAGEGKPAPATGDKPVSDDFKVKGILDSGPGWIKLDTDKGAVVRKGTANWRMNNPGNIRYGGFARSQGAIGEGDAGPSGKFAVFPTLESGLKAKEELLFGSKSRYAPMSIWDAMHRYAPESDNNKPAAYAEMIAKNAGVGVQTKLADLNSGQRQSMLDSINKHEGFKEGKTFKAKGGGVFDGPDSGYLVELHGNEMVAPTEKFRQLLDNMTQVTKQDLGTVTQPTTPSSTITTNESAMDPTVFIDMMDMMKSKFDELIATIQSGNNTQSKILKYSKT